MPEGAVYVGRPSRFGNPFKVGDDGQIRHVDGRLVALNGVVCLYASKKTPPRAFLTEAFRAWLTQPGMADERRNVRAALRGKDLACWCPIGEPCHADVLLEMANR